MRTGWPGIILLAFAAGCGQSQSSTNFSESPAAPIILSVFDPNRTGIIQGRVTWEGPAPTAPLFDVRPNPFPEQEATRTNPNLPMIDLKSGGVAGAVVYLKGVDRNLARPWDHPPVTIDQRDLRLLIYQGFELVHTGFVRKGDAIEAASSDPLFHGLRGRGDDFFTLPFPIKGKYSRRSLSKTGRVELQSGAGYPWMRGYLFVDDHPYFTRTDDQGRFQIPHVSPGNYQVVCWLPNWHLTRQDINPENALMFQAYFADPQEKSQNVSLEPFCRIEAQFSFQSSDFAPQR